MLSGGIGNNEKYIIAVILILVISTVMWALTKSEIDTNSLNQIKTLETQYYKNKEISKASFDSQHGAVWNAHKQVLLDNGLIKPDPIKVTPRDFAKEIDALKARIEILEGK